MANNFSLDEEDECEVCGLPLSQCACGESEEEEF